ncbi:MAG TPA: FTR1 family protein [Casimicrobiaceae bacterium]|nr:FTR1 family protein [Casimicrobiaceae bacterium]
MLATAVIVFRETLEAALIVSIVLAATRGIARRGAWIGSGIATGVGGALAIAGLAGAIAGAFHGIGQELFNACVLIAAVAMLGWHHLWMAAHGRALAGRLRTLSDSVRQGSATLAALSLAVGLAVLREGAETVLFLQGVAITEPLHDVLAGLALGAGGGAALGGLLYLGLVRVPVRHFFRVTGWMIVVLAAGLAAQAARFLEQANLLPPLVPELWDTSSLLSATSLPGQLLHILVGYTPTPSATQLAFYLATLTGLILASRWRIATARRAPLLPSA